MGFGSYDETEQERQAVDVSLDDDQPRTREADHEGTVEYEVDASSDDLLARLQEIKES